MPIKNTKSPVIIPASQPSRKEKKQDTNAASRLPVWRNPTSREVFILISPQHILIEGDYIMIGFAADGNSKIEPVTASKVGKTHPYAYRSINASMKVKPSNAQEA